MTDSSIARARVPGRAAGRPPDSLGVSIESKKIAIGLDVK
jgi:hypothetical protein